jgi:hypothetical protein
MDNSRDLPGYKYFVDAGTGERPDVYVAFLDLADDPGSAVNGVAFPVAGDALAALDRRERNYERRDVTEHVDADPPIGGRVWAYFGSAAAHERFARGNAVISRAYLDLVRAGFDRLGPGELSRFDTSTEAPPVPVRDLRRIDIPLPG